MQKSKLSAKPIRAVNSAGGTLLIFSMKRTLTVMLSPRFDLAPATRQTQHQIMYQCRPRKVRAAYRNCLVILHVFSGVADNSSLACFCPEGYTGPDQNPCLLMSAQAAVRKPV